MKKMFHFGMSCLTKSGDLNSRLAVITPFYEVFKSMVNRAIRGIDPALDDAIPETDNPISSPTTRDDGHFYFVFRMNK
ncbi:hypothetical protein AVP43_00263 [Geobacillus stearothermophilus]|nr:hypothetical protein AVP43_00263 [Geobacillus stearothermophilus]